MRHWGGNHTLYPPSVALFRRVNSVQTKDTILAILLSLSMVLLPCSAMAETPTEPSTYTVHGSLFNNLGDEAGSTSIKVDSLESVWSENGQYEITGVTHGEHTIRAYFMNDGHTVVYRTIYITGDTELDFHQNKNWITGTIHDYNEQDSVTIEVVETGQIVEATDSLFEFEPNLIGDYYSIHVEWEKDSTTTTQSMRFKLETGSASYPAVNHFDLHHGNNNIYGILSDGQGEPVANAVLSNGVDSAVTNADGFYLLRNLAVGSEHTLTIQQEGNDLMPAVQHVVVDGTNWLNLTTETDVEFPGVVAFVTQTQAVTLAPFQIEWAGSVYTDYFSLYDGVATEENLIYRGPYSSMEYTPDGPGTYEFNIVAHNANGTNEETPALVMIVLPNPSNDYIWQSGMSWDYFISHTPDYFHNRTYTAIGTETITDAFGVDKETFLVRIADDSYYPNEKAFRWIDAENLLPVKTYWVDDPDSSSYFQEGTMGWDFTNQGQSSGILSDSPAESLHFNRTNIIGVPGHPNGYDDTYNSIAVTEDVEITVAGITYNTKYIAITDENDGILSWELWYNSTVRNYVKIVDRLPGSHSDSVVYELTGYEIPTSPKFITESGESVNRTFPIEWAEFSGAAYYQLLQNGEMVYEGELYSHTVQKLNDGSHVFKINAVMESGYIIGGNTIEINVDFIPLSPTFNPLSEDKVFTVGSDETVELSWSEIPDHAWYSVIVQDQEGNVTEIFNGTENSTTLNDLSVGQNRLRVNVMVDGKLSEYSPSIFIMIDESKAKISDETDEDTSDDGKSVPAASMALCLMTLLIASMVHSKRRS